MDAAVRIPIRLKEALSLRARAQRVTLRAAALAALAAGLPLAEALVKAGAPTPHAAEGPAQLPAAPAPVARPSFAPFKGAAPPFRGRRQAPPAYRVEKRRRDAVRLYLGALPVALAAQVEALRMAMAAEAERRGLGPRDVVWSDAVRLGLTVGLEERTETPMARALRALKVAARGMKKTRRRVDAPRVQLPPAVGTLPPRDPWGKK